MSETKAMDTTSVAKVVDDILQDTTEKLGLVNIQRCCASMWESFWEKYILETKSGVKRCANFG